MNQKRERLFLIDGSALVYRAFFAFIRNPLINSKGENTSATYGVVNSLLKIIKDEAPDYLAIVFDTKEPTFRHKMSADYKSTRAKMPDDLVNQLPRMRQAIETLNIRSFDMVGFEADDIIGTFAVRAAAKGLDVYCATGDKDYFQLVSDHIAIYYPKPAGESAEIMRREEVKAKFGVYPEQIIDKLALMGDSSDNVPGIPGVGPKSADQLLEQFGSLEAILERHSEISAKGLREKVANGIESAKLSKQLVTIKTDVPLDIDLEELRRKPINFTAAKELFMEMEFKGLVKQVMESGAQVESTITEITAQKSTQKAEYETIDTIPALKKLITKLSKAKEIAVDTETTSVDSLQAKLVGVSLSDAASSGYYLPFAHQEGKNLPFDEGLALVKELLENPKVQKIGQNLNYDLQIFRNYGVDIIPASFDTMLASYVINPSSRQHSLDDQALKHFDYQMQPISDLIGTGKNQKTFDTVPVDKATFYAAEDADFTLRLRGILAPQIDAQDLHNLYYNVELPLVKVLADMEREGVLIDKDFLGNLSTQMEITLTRLTKEIYAAASGEFKIGSTQQLAHVLFEKLGLPTKGKTAKKTGFSTDASVLEELAKIHPFPKLVLEFRELTKLKSTYIDALPLLINPNTGRVHTTFNQTVAATGRLASTDPNLQNIPIRTEIGRQIRKAFLPRDKNHTLLVADYSQIELRILAHYTEDPGLISAFKNNEDIHQRTAAEVYGVPLNQVTPDMRRAAKTANFSIIYGVTAFGLSQQAELTMEQAKEFINTYFTRYPGIKKYMEDTKQFARDNGYVTTLFKRRRYLPEINDKNPTIRQFAERVAINTPIQGTAADMIKVAMINIHKEMSGMKSKMILQVHDELVFDVHKDEVEKMKTIVKNGMEKAMKLKAPIAASMGTGPNWLDAK